LAQLIDYAVSVTGLLLGLLAGCVALRLAPSSSWPRRWLAAVLVIYLAASVHGVTRVLSRPLRHGFHWCELADAPADTRAIVVLGACGRTVHGRSQKLSILNLAGAARVLEAERVFHLLGSPLIISSGGAAVGYDMVPESDTMKTALIELGVPAGRILVESSSRVTHDEAVLTARMLPTSASPRSCS
jgi:uncharacterized SAM-binding protein YcdF (DUF218 family)